ncbi:MAG TPA: hypothetical protein VGD40_06300 [Chryseosolibacter sp.]
MKTLIIIGLLIAISIHASIAQKNRFGISGGIGNGIIMKQALEGGAGYDLNSSFSLGFQYERKLSGPLYFMAGGTWYKSSVFVTPSFQPGLNMPASSYDLQVIYLPIMLKLEFAKYLFVNGGLIADVDVTPNRYITNQSGVGAGFGIGAQVPIRKKFLVQLNPYLNFHGLLMADTDQYPERVLDSGVKLSFLLRR